MDRIASIEDRLARLERIMLVETEANIADGMSAFMDDISNKQKSNGQQTDAPTASSTNTLNGDSTQTEGDLSPQALDDWALSFTPATWKEFLDARGLGHLESSLSFLQDTSIRARANEAKAANVLAGKSADNNVTHQTYAYSVVRGAELGDAEAKRMKEENAEAFEFTYGKTWEEAAEEAKKAVGR